MIKTPCPYCQHPEMPAPPKGARPFGKCPRCGRKSRAAISHGMNGEIYVHYSATHPHGMGLIKLDTRIRPDQAARLKQEINASETVRAALDLYFKQRATALDKT